MIEQRLIAPIEGSERGQLGDRETALCTQLPQLQITGALRFAYWQNGAASRTDLNVVTGQITKMPFDDRSDTAVSPKFALLDRASNRLGLRASAYQAFRAPTLNELYRQFRVGNVVTLVHADLGPERLMGERSGCPTGMAAI